MKQNFKRFLSIVLTCVMLVGMLPVSAFAAEADETTPVVETPVVVETTTAPETTVPETTVPETTVPETTVPETTVPETTVPETTVPETTVPETTVPETTVPETTVPETTVPETTVPETTVPEETVPEVTVAEDPVQDLYDTLMAFETYEALGDYMDAMSEEQYALMDQFSDEQNNALFAKVDQLLGSDDVAVYRPGDNGPHEGDDEENTSVGHIDIACEDLSVKIGDTDFTFNFSTEDVKNGTVEVYINGTRSTDTDGYSTDSDGNNQVRMDGTFDVGTKEAPVQYTVVVKKQVTTEKYGVVYLTLSVSSNYWASNNVCPGKHGDNVADGAGIDVVMNSSNAEYTRLDINKIVAGLDLAANKTYQFEIRDSEGNVVKEVGVEVHADGTAGNLIVTGLAEGTYTVVEKESSAAVNGYSLETTYSSQSVSVVAGTPASVTVTNAYTADNPFSDTFGQVLITGQKIWDDDNDAAGVRPEEITVNLLANGVKVASQKVTGPDWSWTFDISNGIPGTGASPVGVDFTVEEEGVDNYILSNTVNPSVEFNYPSTGSAWSGEKSCSSLAISSSQNAKTVVVAKKGKEYICWSWDPLAKFERELIVQSVAQVNGMNPTMSNCTFINGIGASSSFGMTVTETEVLFSKTSDWSWIAYGTYNRGSANSTASSLTNKLEDTSVTVTKAWHDADNQDGIRPASVTVNLLANGEAVDSATLNADGKWTHTFKNLAKFAEGEVIEYTIEEVPVDGYDAVIDGYNVTNTHKPETIELTVQKLWEDNDNQDGIRPASITVNLKIGEEIIQTVTITAEDEWKHTFTDLDKYADGVKIQYSVEEVPVDGYDTSIEGTLITNTHAPEKISVSVSKVWDDNNNQDGKRPTAITYRLWNGEEEVASKAVTAADNWAWIIKNLDKYANGVEISYSITEDAIADYEEPVITGNKTDGFVVTNKHEIEKTSVSGAKTWDDNNNQDGKRPASITINLLANDNKVDSKTVTAADGWKWSFNDLDKYANGVEIQYVIAEEAVAEYSTTYSGYNVTNKHEIEKISVAVAKTWDDADNQDGKRPASITYRLWNGEEEVASKAVTAENNWAWTFENLDKYAAGEEIAYTITEDAVADYDTPVITGNKSDGFVVTNTHEPEQITVSVSKVWEDSNNQDGVRPASITYRLWNGEEEVASKAVTAADHWAWTFENLDKFEAGKEIAYTVTEDAVDDYDAPVITGDMVDGFVVTNTHNPELIDIPVAKVWVDADDQDGLRTESITVVLLNDVNGNPDFAGKSLVLSDANEWQDVFEDLPKYRDGGIEIDYTVDEIKINGYEVDITGSHEEGYTITNTHIPETTAVEGAKNWNDDEDRDGLRPESITINLVADDKIIETIEVTEKDGWVWSFEELPVYRDHGTEIVYEITEEAVDGYTTVIEGFNVTNTHEIATTEVKGAKTWNDDNDRDGLRPESITISLLADGQAIDTIEVTEEDGWAWSFEELPVYRDQGTKIVYTVAEAAVEGYETVIEGFDITNTHEIATTEVKGAKTWDDANNQDGKRPASITINLVADGEIIETIEVTEAEGWAWSFTELPVYKDHGVEIVYAITENAVEGYATTYDGYNVINSYTPEETSVTVTKAWADSNNAEGIRPGSVTIRLMANGVFTGLTLELDAQSKWVGSFTGLPKYFEGELVEYTVDEVAVKGYTTVIKGNMEEGFTVTNTHVYIPQTGDDRTPMMWITMMAVSAMMIALASIDSKKRRNATK